jgi:6-phosphogluconolactonase
MQFRKITSPAPVAEYIAGVITEHLDKQERVLWLVPGGSSISIAAEVSKLLAGKDLDKLSVSLTDERFGPVGHPDSNWRQLEEAGFDLPGAQLVPVLTGQDRAATTESYGQATRELLAQAEFKLGFFGVGADGHTAGALPGSPAAASTEITASYDAGNYERITITPATIAQLDEAVVYATGEAKWPVFDALETVLPVFEQPAQVLKQVPKLTIFNDYKGDEA